MEKIENELDKINTMTLSMVGDEEIQKNMTIMYNTEVGSDEWLGAKQEISTRVNRYLYNMDAFSEFGIFTNKGTTISSLENLSKQDSEKLAELAAESKGASRIVIYRERLYFLREIREIKNFAFTNLGTMIGEIDIRKMLNECGAIYRGSGVGIELSVYVEDVCIYRGDESMKPLEVDGWQIQGSSFIVQCTTDRGWKFLIYTPYDEVYSFIRVIMLRFFFLTLFIAMMAMYVGCCLTKRITRDLDKLMCKFNAYRKGVLPSKEDVEQYIERYDEIGQLHRHFDQMVYENKQLNDENYNRMLLQKEAEYKYLQQQIQPHFIFNTLSMIIWIAYEHNDEEIATLSSALSRMLRESMYFGEKMVMVKDELRLVADYMFIQRKRYRDRMNYEMNVPEELESVLIPHMTIQPIVENAVKYALEEMLDCCTIRVWGKIEEKTAIIVVEDNGPGIDADILRKLETGESKAEGNGIGLLNIQKRIQLMFSDAYGLEFRRVGDCTQVWLKVPIECKREEQNV